MWPGSATGVAPLDAKSPFFVSRLFFSGYHDLRGKSDEDRGALVSQLRQEFDQKFDGQLSLNMERWGDLRLIWGESITNACLHSGRNLLDQEFVSFVVTVELGQMILAIVNSTSMNEWQILPVCDLIARSGRGCYLADELVKKSFSGKIYRSFIPQRQFDFAGHLDL